MQTKYFDFTDNHNRNVEYSMCVDDENMLLVSAFSEKKTI